MQQSEPLGLVGGVFPQVVKFAGVLLKVEQLAFSTACDVDQLVAVFADHREQAGACQGHVASLLGKNRVAAAPFFAAQGREQALSLHTRRLGRTGPVQHRRANVEQLASAVKALALLYFAGRPENCWYTRDSVVHRPFL